MPTTTPKPPPIPDIDAPLVDPHTGRMTPEWFKYFAFLDRIIRQLREEIP